MLFKLLNIKYFVKNKKNLNNKNLFLIIKITLTFIFAIIVVIYLTLTLGCAPENNIGNPEIDIPEKNPNENEQSEFGIGYQGITKEQCLNSNGFWNECGSPCAGTDARYCIRMCRVQCECNQKQYNCPQGYKCLLSGKNRDEMGVCIKT